MRLIDADALAKFIDYGHLNNPNEKLYSENDIREMIDMMPTVDAVPIVRCKDCKHYYALNEVRGNCSEYNFIEKIPIDYCSWAERKEE
jgi:hypothetical protein